MKSTLIIFMLGTLISCSSLNSTISEYKFDYLIGDWERTNGRPGTKTIESWTKTSDRDYSAISEVLVEGDTVYKKTVRLEKSSDTFFYIADVPQNPNSTNFRIVEIGLKGFSALNGKNDFPKKIKYERKSAAFLHATISGNGKEVLYKFKKID